MPLHVALELKLIEKGKRAKEFGKAEATVEVVRLTSGDAIISGNINVAMGGFTVLFNLHDKTVGENSVKGIMASADSPIAFNTIDPHLCRTFASPTASV